MINARALSALSLLVLALLPSPSSSFTSSSRRSFSKRAVSSQTLAASSTDESDGGNILSSFFTGGILDDDADSSAVQLASRIKSVQDLGWTQAPKRRGSTRPRHRAFGGEGELPIQLKANYDESMERCPEKWLTQEELNAKLKDSSPAADTVFVALAGGAKYAEREECESKLAQWREGGSFNEASFLKSVNAGRVELVTGWALFLSITGAAASCIILPTNPLAKALEGAIEGVKVTYGLGQI